MKPQFQCTHNDKLLFPDGCATCHYLNRKPRAAVTLAQAMEFARAKVAEGKEVHLLDETTRAKKVFHKFTRYQPADFDVTEPERRVFVVALS